MHTLHYYIFQNILISKISENINFTARSGNSNIQSADISLSIYIYILSMCDVYRDPSRFNIWSPFRSRNTWILKPRLSRVVAFKANALYLNLYFDVWRALHTIHELFFILNYSLRDGNLDWSFAAPSFFWHQLCLSEFLECSVTN